MLATSAFGSFANTFSATDDHRNAPRVPFCDRCHTLVHNHHGQPAKQPTLQTIGDLLMESPYKRNHIYQVLDAADFPLSLIPQLQPLFGLTPQRSRNRRSKSVAYRQDRKFETSFVIARSDLLAPMKEQVDAMMPTLVEILRDALNVQGDRFRLGNVYCVSSKRGWWTQRLKEDVWSRGGGGWMLGMVNVGKSSLFEAAFPKGSHQGFAGAASSNSLSTTVRQTQSERSDALASSLMSAVPVAGGNDLLPPAPRFEPFPVMPIISSLPGTTVSPVRLPFGNGKGELIDLPGLARDSLDKMILGEAKASLVMTSRIRAPQYTIKPGQSLVVSNLVRITPEFDDLVLLACPFLPLCCHVTSTEKAKAILAQENFNAVGGTAQPRVASLVTSAGVYRLKWDVTKHRTGPLTASDAARLRPQTLPFVVYSLDLLLQGVGWIELAVQVRKRQLEGEDADSISFPSVEVFSPNGKFIGSRRSLNAWTYGGLKRKPVSRRTSRPRLSKKGEKKRLKTERRQVANND